MEKKQKAASVDEYIDSFPAGVRERLALMRALVRQAAPHAEERLSYGMPAYFFKGAVVWFAGHTNHIGLYPKARAIVRFRKDLSRFSTSKGTIQFPLDTPLPRQLIKRIVKFRIAENIGPGKARTRRS
jgi:uncharacterized protein YdhG (YjbR/CyaY superfamily)